MKNKKTVGFLGIMIASATLVLASCNGGGGNTKPSQSNSDDSSGKYDEDGLEIITDANAYTGSTDFSQLDWKEKSKITAALEEYAVMNFQGGIPLYDDSSSEAFSQRVTPKSTKYITNYGFGVHEGKMDGEMMYNGTLVEPRAEYRSYFHTYTSVDSGTFNGWTATGSDVSERHSMISSSYFGVEMDGASQAGYKWVGSLSRDDAPTMLTPIYGTGANKDEIVDYTETPNPGNDVTSSFWRVYVHVGGNYKYNTVPGSKWANNPKYEGRAVKAEDYLVPFKAMLDNKLSRYSDLVSDASGFYGANDYVYNSSNKTTDLTKWYSVWQDKSNPIGIKINEKASNEAEGYAAIDFRFNQPKGVNSARTALSSSLYSPLPQEFLNDINGAKNFGVMSTGASKFDNFLCFGAYTPVVWEKGKEMVYSKNTSYYEADQYSFDGYVEKVYGNSATADEDAWKDFKENKLDECTVPISALKTDMPAYRAEHPDKVLQTEGSTIIKINLNTTTKREWNYFFGPDGKVYPHADSNAVNTGTGKWSGVKDIMSNKNFLSGFYFAVNRQELAKTAGRKAALGYLSNAYMIDPTGTVSYRESDAGKALIENIEKIAGNEYGYSQSVAENFFKRAGEELIASGKFESGDTIQIEGFYRYQSTIDNLGKYIQTDVANAFNKACKDIGLTLEIVLKVGGTSYTDTYTIMDHGEFDFAEGAVSGNVLDPLNFMSTCSTTQALNQGFCLNWGRPTDHLAASPVVYGENSDGSEAHWAYDALWNASQGFTVVRNGVSSALADNQRFLGPNQVDTGTGIKATEKEILFLMDYPSEAVYDEKDEEAGLGKFGESKYSFAISDTGIFPQNDAGTIQNGFYFRAATLSTVNTAIKITLPLATVMDDCRQLATATNPITKITIQFYLVYTVYPGTNRQNTKTMIIVANANLSNLGMDPISK